MKVGLKHLRSGKVRDLYDAGGDRLLLVASDRISAFDVVLDDPVPDKGRVLTGPSTFWFEQTRDKAGAISFTEHRIMGTREEESKFGVAFSQPHALAMADLDGDGAQDLVVGKRRWAHGPKGDVEPDAEPVVYAFRLVRDGTKKSVGARFVPHRIDDASGVGVQITAGDVTGDGRADVLTASKLGTFLFVGKP